MNEIFQSLLRRQSESGMENARGLFGMVTPSSDDLPGLKLLHEAGAALEAQRTSTTKALHSTQAVISEPSSYEQPDETWNPFNIPDPIMPTKKTTTNTATGSGSYADFTFNREARRDKQGRLKVYKPPSGDGGGAYEVAGITAKYQGEEAARLRRLIETGQHAQAEKEARAFYERRAAPFIKHTSNKGLQLQLSDTVHHRGEGGLRKILKRATGGNGTAAELIYQLGQDPNSLKKFHDARQAYEWEEVDRGRASREQFRVGLQNRFNDAYRASINANQV